MKKFIYVNPDGDYQESPGGYETSDFVETSVGAGDAGKPIILDSTGKLDPSLIDITDIDHGLISGLADDDHTQYTLVDGSRAFTGNQSLGGNLITNLGAPVNPNDAVRKTYVDNLAVGVRVHGNCRVTTTGNIDLSSAPATIDGITMSNGDRVLVRLQTASTENGIYVYDAAGSPMTRAEDFDNSPVGEIWNGAFIPIILEGTFANIAFILTSVGTGTDDLHQIGIDDIIFEQFTTTSQLTAGNGILIDANVVSVDLKAADSGLYIDAIGDKLGIEWATTFTIDAADDLALKASDLANTANGYGASIIGIEDSGGNFTATNLEAVLAELASGTGDGSDYNTYTAGESLTAGDLVYISGSNTVSILGLTTGKEAIGIVMTSANIGEPVNVAKDDSIATGVISGGTPGEKYFWNGTGWQLTMPTGSGEYVWLGGIAKNASDMQVETRFIKRNSIA